MQAKELREMSVDELKQKSAELREEIAHLRLKRSTSQGENPMKLRGTRRDLARTETILREKERAVEKGAA
jgi:large subunit ribosomal protein L29